MLDATLVAVLVIIAMALTFDFINGFHDAANSIATVVSTRVLTPLQGVCWAAFFNFLAAFLFGTAVAKTVGAGLVNVNEVNYQVIFAGLVGAIVWDLATWWWGLPVSSSQALIGGYGGAAVAMAGWGVLIPAGWIKTLAFIVIAPVLGWFLGSIIMIIVYWLFRKTSPAYADRFFRRGQLVSAALYSLGHGGNDAQKTMGIIAGLLFTMPQYQHLVTGPSRRADHSVLDRADGPCRHCARDTLRRLANHPHHGQQDHQIGADGRLCGRDGRRDHHLHLQRPRHPRLDHSNHHGRNRRRRLDPAAARRALGRGQPDRLGVAAHHSRVRVHRRRRLPAGRADLTRSIASE